MQKSMSRSANAILRSLMIFALVTCMFEPNLAQANERPILRAITNEDAYPYNFQLNKRIDGLVYEIAKTLAERAGYTLQAEAQPWTRALQTAKDYPNIMVFSLARNTEREDAYYWIGPVTSSEVWLFRLKNRTDIELNSLEGVKRYTIGDVASSSTIALLNKHGAKIDSAPSNLSNCRKLKVGRIDLVPFDPNGIKTFLHTCGLKVEDVERVLHLPRDTSLYIALGKKSDKALIDLLNVEFQQMAKEKTLQRIHEQWKVEYKKQ